MGKKPHERLKNTPVLFFSMEQVILFRAILEVLGKPKEHVESSLKSFLQKLKGDSSYKIVHEEAAEIKKQENNEFWATFVELEIKTSDINKLVHFCFEYMPSLIEIIEPKKVSLSDTELSFFLNDLQARLHHVDMLAKHVKMENDHFQRNMAGLLQNYVTLLLKKGSLSSPTLSQLTGVDKDKLEDFLDHMIDDGRIDMKEGIYFLTEKIPQKETL